MTKDEIAKLPTPRNVELITQLRRDYKEHRYQNCHRASVEIELLEQALSAAVHRLEMMKIEEPLTSYAEEQISITLAAIREHLEKSK